MIDTHFVRRDPHGSVVCATCGEPASHVATYEKTDDSGRGAWALCAAHAPLGLIAFGPTIPLADFIEANPLSPTPEPGHE